MVDLIIIAVIIIAIFLGWKRGLTQTLVSIFSFIIALIVAFMLCKPIGNVIIDNTKIDDNLKATIKSNIPMNDAEFGIEGSENLPKQIQDYINNVGNSATQSKDEIIENVTTELSKDIIYIVTFIIIYLVVRVALLIVKILSKFITKLPVLHQIDSIGGAACGLVEGIFIVYFIFTVISIMSPILSETQILTQINSSNIGKHMYNNNVIANRVISKNK